MDYVVPRPKIFDFLLTNPRKSGFFLPFGYAVEDWTVLRDDLLKIVQNFPRHKRRTTEHGDEYEVVGDVTAPNGRTIRLRTGWIIRKNEEGIMAFVTAYPAARNL